MSTEILTNGEGDITFVSVYPGSRKDKILVRADRHFWGKNTPRSIHFEVEVESFKEGREIALQGVQR